MIIETNRLVLREFIPGDLQEVHKYASDVEVCKYSDWGPNRLEDTKAFIEEVVKGQGIHPRNQFTLAIIVKETNGLIGACNLIRDRSQGEIGYSINRNYWGFGFATEAAEAMLDFGFNELNPHRIYATCRPNNVGSIRVLEKIGMRIEGHLREHRFFKGKWHDSFLYAILRSEMKKSSEE
ncbi:Protein N-acetyltransferase, RimJ/RimL family [Paenibacillus tianmuensis]|uniref:Protein N-acetyltransferase, RimJ/RimL family n=1 Tax=Paenibacillus tianmuensis TaxID=624147 RepID=A0A1G4S9N3_9BACL|nr:GNAT family protein [Paenibacillus tianmuensis]SCW65914.1 Protein N-acetyltransferase, RimJ/RimL family [Paenibacillus tianmuensis]